MYAGRQHSFLLRHGRIGAYIDNIVLATLAFSDVADSWTHVMAASSIAAYPRTTTPRYLCVSSRAAVAPWWAKDRNRPLGFLLGSPSS